MEDMGIDSILVNLKNQSSTWKCAPKKRNNLKSILGPILWFKCHYQVASITENALEVIILLVFAMDCFTQSGFSTLSSRYENDEFQLVLAKSSRPTSSSVSSKKSNFSIFWQIFKHFSVNFGMKLIAIKFPFFWYYLHYY